MMVGSLFPVSGIANGADNTTWSPTLTDLVKKSTVDVRHYDLELSYDFWKYCRCHLALFGLV